MIRRWVKAGSSSAHRWAASKSPAAGHHQVALGFSELTGGLGDDFGVDGARGSRI